MPSVQHTILHLAVIAWFYLSLLLSLDELFLPLPCHMLQGCCVLSLLRLLHVSSQTLKCRPTTRSLCKWIEYLLIQHPNCFVLRCHLIYCGIHQHLFAPMPNAIFQLFLKHTPLSHLQTRTSSHMSNLNLLCNKVRLDHILQAAQCMCQAHAWKICHVQGKDEEDPSPEDVSWGNRLMKEARQLEVCSLLRSHQLHQMNLLPSHNPTSNKA
mmetsp:Transcript_20304/g.29039  ORF Transcript_20304/g.29039 Transcript_20304/m.29039 type:complete len:211 (+) Transcript_20304:829-1461(+)